MREVGAFEAKTKFGQLLDWVEAGEEVVITRRGKVVARMVTPNAKLEAGPARHNPEAAKAIIEKIRKLRAGVTLGDVTIRELINEGRK